jgi:hypothetical protein
MASPGAVYHPEEIELMTAALDDAVKTRQWPALVRCESQVRSTHLSIGSRG